MTRLSLSTTLILSYTLCVAYGCGAEDTSAESGRANSWETSELMPEEAITAPEEVVSEPEEQPEARTAPDRYAMRDGMPVPDHVGSFVQTRKGFGRQCVIDDFAQLLCWQTDTYDQPAPKVDYIEPVAQDVHEMSLHGDTLCIIQGDSREVSCLGDDDRFESIVFKEMRGPASNISTHYAHQVCVLDSGSRLHCVFKPEYDNDDGEFVQIELADIYPRTYKIFRLEDHAATRIASRCAVDTQNTLHCWSGFNYSMNTDDVSGVNFSMRSPRGEFQDMRHDRFNVVALIREGTVELYGFDAWAYGSTEPPKLLRTIPGSYTRLYSSDCGQRADGAVVCWDSGEDVTVLEEEPRDLHVDYRGMYGITQDGELFSEVFER